MKVNQCSTHVQYGLVLIPVQLEHTVSCCFKSVSVHSECMQKIVVIHVSPIYIKVTRNLKLSVLLMDVHWNLGYPNPNQPTARFILLLCSDILISAHQCMLFAMCLCLPFLAIKIKNYASHARI